MEVPPDVTSGLPQHVPCQCPSTPSLCLVLCEFGYSNRRVQTKTDVIMPPPHLARGIIIRRSRNISNRIILEFSRLRRVRVESVRRFMGIFDRGKSQPTKTATRRSPSVPLYKPSMAGYPYLLLSECIKQAQASIVVTTYTGQRIRLI
jgi:hypothetical protein